MSLQKAVLPFLTGAFMPIAETIFAGLRRPIDEADEVVSLKSGPPLYLLQSRTETRRLSSGVWWVREGVMKSSTGPLL